MGTNDPETPTASYSVSVDVQSAHCSRILVVTYEITCCVIQELQHYFALFVRLVFFFFFKGREQMKVQVSWSVTQCHCLFPDIFKDDFAFIFRVKKSKDSGLHDREDEGAMILHNRGAPDPVTEWHIPEDLNH